MQARHRQARHRQAPSPATGKLGDLGVRAASTIVLVAVALGSVWIGGMVFAAVWLVAAVAIHWEWQRLIGGERSAARVAVGTAWLVALAIAFAAIAFAAFAEMPFGAIVIVATAAVAGTIAWLAGYHCRLWAAGGIVYATAFLAAILALRLSPQEGGRAVVWLFATVWATDVFAYFGGRLIGGPKLWPRVSPSKTWSGTLTGIAAAGAIGTAVALYGLPAPTAALPVFGLTLAASAISQAGDAGESAMKRRFGAKDSSRLIPGHGGAMDRLDGFLAATVFAALLGLSKGEASVAAGLFHWS